MELFTANTAIYLLSNVLFVYSYYRVYGVFFDRNAINRQLEALCFIGYFCLNCSVFLLINEPIFNLLSSLGPLIAITFLYPTRIRIKLPVAILGFAFAMTLDNLFYFIFMRLRFDLEVIPFFVNVFTALGVFFATLVVQKFHTRTENHSINTLHWLAICFIPVGSMAVIASMFYFSQNTATMLVTSFVLFFINVLVFYLFDAMGKYYTDRSEKQLLQQQNRAYSDQFALMREAEQQVRTLRHDMKNHLSILRQYADEGRTEELEQYLDAFALKLSPKAEYVATGNRELDSILNYKLGQAEAAGAVLTLDVSLPEQLVVDVFDLNVVLGNLLDNATEGVAGSSDKGLSLYLRLDRGVLYIKLTNAYDGVVNIERTADALRYRTRKQDSALHGLGLESVKATVEKYHGYLEISHQDKQFTVEAVLYTA